MDQALNDIYVQTEMVSLEAFAGMDAVVSAAKRLPELFNSVKSFVSSKINADIVSNHFYKPEVLRYVAGNKNYLAYANIPVYKAPGQKVTSLVLTETLFDNFKTVIEPFSNNLLPSVDKWIGSIVSNPEELRSAHYQVIVPSSMISKRDVAVKRLASCFDLADTKADVLFKDIYERNADLETVVKKLAELNEMSFKVSGAQILKHVDSLTSAFDIVIKHIENNEPGFEMSPTVIKGLAGACYDLAQLVEFYSVYMYKLREQTVAVRDTLTKLKSI